jgi:capsular exopolysaccharide synthesis family protein
MSIQRPISSSSIRHPEPDPQPRSPGWHAAPGSNGPPEEEPSTLERWWAIFRRRKWVMLQALVIIPLVVFVITLTQQEKYTAKATLLFQNPTVGLVEGESAFVDPARAAATNTDLASLPVVAEKAAEKLHVSPQVVDARIEVNSSATADLADIESTSTDPKAAAATANAYAEAYIQFRRTSNLRQLGGAVEQLEESIAALSPADLSGPRGVELRDQLDRLKLAASVQTGNAELVQRAGPPTQPSSPDMKRNLFLGIVLALAVAFGLAALLERVDRAVRDPGEFEKIYNLPLLARIPRSKALSRATHKLTDLAGKFGEVEAFRTLRANLRYFNVDGALDSLLIVSPLAGDGKSTVADFLAMTMASMGDRAILVETDLHKGEGSVGLSSVLSGDDDLSSAITEIDLGVSERGQQRTLHMLPSGPAPPNPFELLESERMAEVLTELRSRYDLVLLDSPALSAVSDALALVPKVSGVLVVGALGHSTRDAADDLRRQLILARGNALGVVANFTAPERGYRYYYRSSPADQPA